MKAQRLVKHTLKDIKYLTKATTEIPNATSIY